MASAFTESTVEVAALAWPEAIGWQVAHAPDIAPGLPAAERVDYGELAPSLSGGSGPQVEENRPR